MRIYYTPDAVASWLRKEAESHHLQEAEAILKNRSLLEAAILLMIASEVTLDSEKRLKEVENSCVETHAASLFLVYNRAKFGPYLNLSSIESINQIREPQNKSFYTHTELTKSQVLTSEKKKNEIIYFLEDLIYYLQEKPEIWWYTCPTFSYALELFKKEREGHREFN